MKKCALCKGDGPFGNDKHCSDGLSPSCKDCNNKRVRLWRKENRKQNNEICKDWRHRNPKASAVISKAAKLKAKYGISIAEFESMRESQGHACAVCILPLVRGRQTHVDHCHKTGKVRGLLCDRCNLGIGYFRDNPDFLHRAAVYVNSTTQSVSQDGGGDD